MYDKHFSCMEIKPGCSRQNCYLNLKVKNSRLLKLLSGFDLHKLKLLILQLNTPKTLIIQIHTSNIWKNASHTFFIQFQNIVEKKFLQLFEPNKTVW